MVYAAGARNRGKHAFDVYALQRSSNSRSSAFATPSPLTTVFFVSPWHKTNDCECPIRARRSFTSMQRRTQRPMHPHQGNGPNCCMTAQPIYQAFYREDHSACTHGRAAVRPTIVTSSYRGGRGRFNSLTTGWFVSRPHKAPSCEWPAEQKWQSPTSNTTEKPSRTAGIVIK